MTTAQISAEVEGDSVLVKITGEIDLANAADVQHEINEAVTNDATRVVLDLANLEYLDSAGLRVLFTLAERLRVLQMGLDLVVPPSSAVRRVVEMSGLEPVARVLSERDRG
ncbi:MULTISPECIES: STAS domain-containing protein [Amycolatopsis]|uniref:Anti-sigma factor antagonist n=2 Tax=Amycolatopsis TaxID=1813 RepID=A0A1I3UFC5_9PSEU|nr:STAS domain-containing protein [Amycolatopsis sacchari]SFJ82214.1 anti-sigma B factor antagonist/stage II sporulation protein AA (anti-sigma F factor antagonist) [Amycolatopsis sacchari]